MIHFDPVRIHSRLVGKCGYEFSLSDNFEEAKAVGGRGSSADAFIGTALQCILCGLLEPATRLLQKAHDWVTVAIDEREMPIGNVNSASYELDGRLALNYQTLAMCNWLLRNSHDKNSLDRYIVHEDRYLSTSPAGEESVNISMTLPTYVDAGAFENGLELFRKTRTLTVPESLIAIRNEGQMCYVICRHRLNQEFSVADVRSALGKFLDRNLDGWLCRGHYVPAAQWMKIAYWSECTTELSAINAVLRCYDHLASSRHPV